VLLIGFWFVAGGAYVFIGIFNYLMARRLRDADIPSAKRTAIAHSKEERERIIEGGIQVMAADVGRLVNGGISQAEYQNRAIEMKWDHYLLNMEGVLENINNAFDSFDRFVSEFNDAAKTNRWVLYAAALSFFLAAAISFAQGLSLL
jgi:hypothetical protein